MQLNPGFRSLALLAPPQARVPGSFTSVHHDPSRHDFLLRQAQTLRGAVYLEDGAIDQSHMVNGRHVVSQRSEELALTSIGRGAASLRLHAFSPPPCWCGVFRLTAAESSLASSSEWGQE